MCASEVVEALGGVELVDWPAGELLVIAAPEQPPNSIATTNNPVNQVSVVRCRSRSISHLFATAQFNGLWWNPAICRQLRTDDFGICKTHRGAMVRVVTNIMVFGDAGFEFNNLA